MSNYRISSEVNHYTDKYLELDHDIAQRLDEAELAIKELQTSALIGSNFLMRSLKILAYNVVGIILVIGAYTVLQYLWELYWHWLR